MLLPGLLSRCGMQASPAAECGLRGAWASVAVTSRLASTGSAAVALVPAWHVGFSWIRG